MNLHLIIYFSLSLRELNTKNDETLTFRVKKTRGEIKNFGIETQSGNRENHAVQIPFWFIPISRSVAEI